MQLFFKLHRMSVLFWLRKKAANKKGEVPIYYRISIDGIRGKDYSTNIKVLPNKWSAGKQLTLNSKLKNERLLALRARIEKILHFLEISGVAATPEIVYNYLNGRKKAYTFLKMFEIFIEHEIEMNAKADKKRILRPKHPNTIKTYEYKIENIRQYLLARGKLSLQISEVNTIFCDDLIEYLTYESKKNLQRAYISRHITVVKKVISFAYRKGFIENNLLNEYYYGRGEDKVPINLTMEEVNAIWVYPFSNEYLQYVADLFILTCFTGFEFRDIFNFSEKNIVSVNNGFFISYARAKNGQIALLPLHEGVYNIAEKYSWCFKKISDKKYNNALKEVAAIVGINKSITARVGRKTFSGLKLNYEGYSPATISKMLGHKKLNTIEHYTFTSDERVYKEVNEKRQNT